ncbi:uncharacterized protein [Phaseolus vulgaris]|uniref:uncharacterized protein n=1 Tax=Phaseolus vulgaris TaxID=3885 RepID=UPI0035CA1D88
MTDNLSLIEGFTEREVRDAVWHVKAQKVRDLTGCIPKGCNASFIALVPKVRNPVSLDYFRPISLVGAMYKIISKVLAERIKKVLPTIIDDCQSAFLKNRGILDNVLMANEVVEDIRRRGQSGLCLKVDFEKAYDSVRWEFLYDMMGKMGFHRKWIRWIQGCLESASISVLVNGSPTYEFKPERGLRQGDPLASFLFLIVAEGLSGLVSNVVTLKAILRGFEVASGLKINFHKSRIAGINVHRNNILYYLRTLNCAEMTVPFKYLGLEVGGNLRSKKFWEPVIDKLESRLSTWRGRFLSMAGRICVIKSMLTAVPLYYLSMFKAPVSVCKNIKRIQRRFLWGWGKEKKSISWVSWENVCKPKQEGGLGIIDIRDFNYALMAKWKWRWLSDEKGRWKDILESKYGGGCEGTNPPIKLQSWWWRDLHKVCMEGGGEGWFQAEMGWRLGCGDIVKFWDDVWVGNTNLKFAFPKLYTISCNQNQTVEEVVMWEGDVWRWNLRWRRARFEWESVMETDLVSYISRAVITRQEQDTRVWGINNKGCFSVKSAYASIRGDGTRNAVFDLLWKAKAFPSVLTTVSNKQDLIWKGIWTAIVRSVWEHRNLVAFKQGVVDAKEMFQQAQLKSWLWMKYKERQKGLWKIEKSVGHLAFVGRYEAVKLFCEDWVGHVVLGCPDGAGGWSGGVHGGECNKGEKWNKGLLGLLCVLAFGLGDVKTGDYRGISYPKASQQYGNSSNIALLVLCSQSSLRQPRILCDVSYNGSSLTFPMLGVVTV